MICPSSTVRAAALVSSLAAAAASRAARACAQACRSAEPECWMDRLPEVTPSSGLLPVLTGATVTRASATSSSSAAIWASAVHTPWPYSTLPEYTVTLPSAGNESQDARRGLAARLTGSSGPAGAGGGACGGDPVAGAGGTPRGSCPAAVTGQPRTAAGRPP